MITFDQVSFTYPGSPLPALDRVTVSLERGEMLALLGPNGSGKSTLARLGNALLVPTAGRVLVDGMDTREDALVWDVRTRVGFIQQNPENQIVGTIAEEDVAFGPENLGVPAAELRIRVDQALDAVGLSGFQRREPHMLSEGQKQRLAIAGALAMRPAYLIADEPTAMLDPVGRDDVMRALESLRADGVGVLLVTHHLEEALTADRLVVLSGGGVAFEGSPAEALSDQARAASLGVEIPGSVLLAEALRSGGVPVPPGVRDPEGLVEALWHS